MMFVYVVSIRCFELDKLMYVGAQHLQMRLSQRAVNWDYIMKRQFKVAALAPLIMIGAACTQIEITESSTSSVNLSQQEGQKLT